MPFIFIDTETGGIGDVSLLSLSMIITDDQFDERAYFYKDLKPDDGRYVVQASGLAVNKINLVEHDKCALTYTEAARDVYEFLSVYSRAGQKYIPAGQGVNFDLLQIWKFLIKRPTWENFCSYRHFDTGVFARGLVMAGLLPETLTGGLDSLCAHFGIKQEQAHHAYDDNKNTIAVAKAEIALIRSLKDKVDTHACELAAMGEEIEFRRSMCGG